MSETLPIPTLEQIAKESDLPTTPLLANYPKQSPWFPQGYWENGEYVRSYNDAKNTKTCTLACLGLSMLIVIPVVLFFTFAYVGIIHN